MPHNRWLRLIFIALAVAAVWLAARDILAQWREVAASGDALHVEPGLIALSGGLVMVSYVVLIETWRRTVMAWGEHLSWTTAARIWFISNLGRYLPGKVWQLGAMSAMALKAGVSAVAAAGSALVVNVVNVFAGFGVAAVTGAEHFENRGTAVAIAILLLAGLLAAPLFLPKLAQAASVVLRRPVIVPKLPALALWSAAAGCIVAWCLYGIAFKLLVAGILGSAPGDTASYIAVFTGSYLVGYIALFAPGGIGVRETSLVVSLGRFALPVGAPGIVALSSRLWLTVLEIVPGVIWLAVSTISSARPSARTDGPTS